MTPSSPDITRRLAAQFRGGLRVTSEAGARAAGVPDPLSLTDMAAAGLNYLRGNPEPARNFECKFALGPLGIPCHFPEWVRPNAYGYDPISLGDTDSRMEWQYRQMRRICGQAEPCAVERGVRARVLGYLRDDGYAWINPSRNAAVDAKSASAKVTGPKTFLKPSWDVSSDCRALTDSLRNALSSGSTWAVPKASSADLNRVRHLRMSPFFSAMRADENFLSISLACNDPLPGTSFSTSLLRQKTRRP